MINPKVIITDAEGFAKNTDPVFLILVISRQEIKTGKFGSALHRLHVMTDSTENILRYRESMTFQVEGYDQDHRELPEIPEVRAYFKALAQAWPHWIWYLFRGTGSIALLMSLLCQVRVIRGTRGDFGTEFDDKVEISAVINDLLDRGSKLFEHRHIPWPLIDESKSSLLTELRLG